MIKLDDRPAIRIAEILGDASIETTDQYAFAQYETVPGVGDLLIKPPPWSDEPQAVIVVQRAYIHPEGELGRWWVVTRAVENEDWIALWKLDRDVDDALAAISMGSGMAKS